MKILQTGFLVVFFAVAMIYLAPRTHAQNLPKTFTSYNSTSSHTIDHSKFAEILIRYRDNALDEKYQIHRFDYGAVTDADKAFLKAYLADMAKVNLPTYRKDVHYAYWLNLYNALVLDLVLEHYPIGNFRDLQKRDKLGSSPWEEIRFQKDGMDISLDVIQHQILRKNYDDWRLFFALHSAVISSGDMPFQPFRGTDIEYALDDLVKNHFQKPLTVSLDGNILRLSAVLHWYQSDFVGEGASASRYNQFCLKLSE